MGLAFLITSDRLQLLSERKVLKEAEYTTLLDAAGVIDAARAEAARIRDHAHEQARQDRARAFDEGLAQGRAAQTDRLLAGAQDSQYQLRALRDAMARLVTKAVAQIVAGADAARVYEAALAKVESLWRDESFVSVRVDPAREDALRHAIAALCERHGADLTVVVQADAELGDGACVMHTASGSLDLGLQAQLDALARAMQADGARPA